MDGALGRLFAPRSIAVIGGRVAARVIARCEALGFTGPIYPVHPTRSELAGRPAVPSVADLPEAPDAAFIAVNRDEAVRIVAELAARGAGGAVVHASGFAEVGDDGWQRQQQLVAAAGSMPVLGPNCLGFINALERVALWADVHGLEAVDSGVALLLQSGNIAINLTMQRRGLPIAFVASLGNAAVLGPAAAIRAVARDRRITAIGLYLEGISDAVALAAALAEARARRLPVVALLAGESEGAREASLGHTAALAADAVLARAWLARLGVPVVEDLSALLAALTLLHGCGPLAGRSLVSLSCSGGEAALVADLGTRQGLHFRPFRAAERARIAATVHPLVRVANPFDYHTFDWGQKQRLRATFEAVLACGFDFAMLVLDWPREDRADAAEWDVAAEAFAEAARATSAAAGVVATLPDGLPEERARQLFARGLVPLAGLREAFAAMAAAAFIGEAWRQPRALPADLPPLVSDSPLSLDEAEAKAVLARAGIPVPQGATVASVDAALALADQLGYPLVAKAVGRHLLHKTEQGAVRLGLNDAQSLAAAVRALLALSDRVRIERMVEGAVVELLLGYRREPTLGGFLVLGAGGMFVELLDDTIALPLPVAAEDVRSALGQLRVQRLMAGFRGRPKADTEAAVAAISRFADWLLREAAHLIEAEINPLLVLPEGQGAIAVDALVVIGQAGEERGDG